MWRSLLTDLESVLKGAKAAGLIRVPKSGPASRGEDAAAFSEWLPYRAWIADRQVFVNLDALGFCLEVRPQSGADEEMARVLTALYAASPPGTGIQFHLYASPAIRAPLARYANLRVADPVVPELDTLGRAGRNINIHRTMARRRVEYYLAGSRASLLPAQNATGNWVKVTQRVPVRIAFDEPPARAMIAGLSTHVRIDTGRNGKR